MRIVFMGTPDFAVEALLGLIEKHDVVGVYTREPKESGRGKKVNKSPVHIVAEKNGIIVRTPKSLKDEEEQNFLRSLNADVAIVAAYGLIIPQAVLDMFPYGCLNIHASLLPRWRGAAPIQRAIETGDKESGITIMRVVAKLDAGDILAQDKVAITPQMTGGDLHDILATRGSLLLLSTLEKLDDILPIKQDEDCVCYAQKIDKAECLLNFTQPTEQIILKIRAFSPYPATYFIYQNERFKILEAESVDFIKGVSGEILEGEKQLLISTIDGAIKVTKIQREGKQPMFTDVLLRGFQFNKGTII